MAPQQAGTALSKKDAAVLALASANSPAFVQTYAPARISTMRVTSPRQVLSLCRTSQVGTIRQFYGENAVKTLAVIKAHLVNLNVVSGVNKVLNAAQIDFVAETIVTDWELMGLTLVDFMLVMRQALTGEVGEMFEALSPQKVLGWLRAYSKERAEQAGKMSREESENYKGDPTRSRYRNEQAAKAEQEAMHRVSVEAYRRAVEQRQKEQEKQPKNR